MTVNLGLHSNPFFRDLTDGCKSPSWTCVVCLLSCRL